MYRDWLIVEIDLEFFKNDRIPVTLIHHFRFRTPIMRHVHFSLARNFYMA